MKRSTFTEKQIAFALRPADSGAAVAEVCRKPGASGASSYNGKKTCGGVSSAA